LLGLRLRVRLLLGLRVRLLLGRRVRLRLRRLLRRLRLREQRRIAVDAGSGRRVRRGGRRRWSRVVDHRLRRLGGLCSRQARGSEQRAEESHHPSHGSFIAECSSKTKARNR
jgi:hypothetical protein